jgi:hypothetical protein
MSNNILVSPQNILIKSTVPLAKQYGGYMKNRSVLIEMVPMAIVVILTMELLRALNVTTLIRIFFSMVTGMVTLVILGHPKVFGAVELVLKRLPGIIFTAALASLGVVVGWTDIGFLFVYLLGVSALALFAVMAIASLFKATKFGRELSERIVEGMLYGVAFMRIPRKRAGGDVGSYIKVIQMNLSRSFEWP